MARKIIDFVLDKQAEILADPEGEGEANAARAVQAIIEGRASEAYEAYMRQFVEKDADGNPTKPVGAAQLARLLADDEPIPGEVMNRKRAYLLANAVCGGGSPTNGGRFDFTVVGIDTGLEFAAEPEAGVNRATESEAAPDAGGAAAG